MPAATSLANLRNGGSTSALAAAAGTCPACTGVGRLHDCESFPLPSWASDYLAGFDSMLSRTTTADGFGEAELQRSFRHVGGDNRKPNRATFLTLACDRLADDLDRVHMIGTAGNPPFDTTPLEAVSC
jgi:hypothetical protein